MRIVELVFLTPPGVNPHVYDMHLDMHESMAYQYCQFSEG